MNEINYVRVGVGLTKHYAPQQRRQKIVDGMQAHIAIVVFSMGSIFPSISSHESFANGNHSTPQPRCQCGHVRTQNGVWK